MKGFTWSGWVKPVSQKPTDSYVIGWDFGDKFDGFHEYIQKADGTRIPLAPHKE